MKQLALILLLLLNSCTVGIEQENNDSAVTIIVEDKNTTAMLVTHISQDVGGYWLDTLIGISYLVLAATGATLYVPCIVVIYRLNSDPSQPSSCFLFMFVMGIADMFQLTSVGLAAGIMSAGFTTVPVWIGKFWGGVLTSAWHVYCPIQLLLAFNRYICVCLGEPLQSRLFGPIETKMWLALIFVWSAGWFVVCLSPFVGLHYIRPYNAYYWGPESWNDVAAMVCVYFDMFVGVLGSFFYLQIALHIRAKKNAVEVVEIAESMGQRERRVLKSLVTIFGYYLMAIIYWFIVSLWLSESHTYLAMYLAHMAWYINALVNPFVYLTMNQTIKEGVLAMLVTT